MLVCLLKRRLILASFLCASLGLRMPRLNIRLEMQGWLLLTLSKDHWSLRLHCLDDWMTRFLQRLLFWRILYHEVWTWRFIRSCPWVQARSRLCFFPSSTWTTGESRSGYRYLTNNDEKDSEKGRFTYFFRNNILDNMFVQERLSNSNAEAEAEWVSEWVKGWRKAFNGATLIMQDTPGNASADAWQRAKLCDN